MNAAGTSAPPIEPRQIRYEGPGKMAQPATARNIAAYPKPIFGSAAISRIDIVHLVASMAAFIPPFTPTGADERLAPRLH